MKDNMKTIIIFILLLISPKVTDLGINLENEVVKFLGGECKFTIDHYGMDLIVDAAINGAFTTDSTTKATPATAIASWTATPSDGEPWLWRKHEIMDRFESGSNNIFAKTLRGVATYILCGNDVARVIKQLPDFKEASAPKVPTGPMNIGTIGGRTVIQDPFMTSTRYVMGYKGDNFLMGSFAYCPSNVRRFQVTGSVNFLNCRNLRVSQNTSRRNTAVKTFECGQSAAKLFVKKSYKLAA